MILLEKLPLLLRSKVASGGLAVIIGSQIANFFAYLYHLFIGRILGPSAYGELASLLALLYIFSVPSEGLRLAATKYYSVFYARGQIGQAKDMYIRFSKYISAISLFGLLISFPFFGILGDYLKIKDSSYFFWIYIAIAIQLINSINVGVLFGYQKFIQSTVFSNIAIIIRLIIGIISAFYGVLATIIGITVSAVLATGFYIFPLMFIFRSKRERSILTKKEVLIYTFPTVLATLGLTALFSMDVILVRHYFSSHDSGIYSSLAVLGKIIFFASNAFGLILFPVIAKKWELKQSIDKEVRISVLSVTILSLLISVLYFFIPNVIVNVLFGIDFKDAAKYLGTFSIFISFFSLSSLFMNIFLAMGKTLVSIFMILAAVGQIIGIQLFHSSIYQVVNINTIVCIILLGTMLIYYPYAKKRIS